jgi:protein SCO1/2
MTWRRGAQRLRAVLPALVAGLLLLTASASARANEDPLAKRFGGPFELTAASGQRVSDVSLHGRLLLISFGYTHCPDICPTTLVHMTEALEKLGPSGDAIQPIFITVDPQRDTTDQLAKFASSFHPRLLMLTGTETEIASVAKAYRVHRHKFLFPGQSATDADYGVDHGSLMCVMGADGRFLTLIPYGATAERIAEVLRRYTTIETVR